MLKTRVVPVLLLQDNALVKTVKFKHPKYVGDVVNAIRIFNEKEVDEIVVLDISATPQKRSPNFDLIKDLAGECFMPLSYGGGVRSLDDMRQLFSLGVEKVAINTHALEDLNFVTQAAKQFGSQSIVVSIDVKKTLFGQYKILSALGKIKPPQDLVGYVKAIEEAGAGEIFLTSVDKDGTLSGYDLDLIRQLTSASSLPLIACGGAGNLADLAAAKQAGASAVAAGSLFVFHGKHKAVLIHYPKQEELTNLLN